MPEKCSFSSNEIQAQNIGWETGYVLALNYCAFIYTIRISVHQHSGNDIIICNIKLVFDTTLTQFERREISFELCHTC